MNSYVVDTNALFWYLLGNHRLLSRHAKSIFDEGKAGRVLLYMPAIVLAELYYANKQEGNLIDFRSTYEQLRNAGQFVLLPFDPDEAPDFDDNAAVPEMHDRMVMGASRRLDAPCLTVDPAIARGGLVTVIW